jgi:REP element-mobilizing transposase RayT
MSRPERKWLFHGTPSWIRPENERFFLTLCCRERGRAQLTTPDVAKGILDSIQFGQKREDWYVRLILLMPDHLHMIATFPDHKASISQTMTNWKRLMARRHRIAWQKGFFDHRLRNDAALDEKAAYIRMNPVRAGLCEQEKDWPYVWEPR